MTRTSRFLRRSGRLLLPGLFLCSPQVARGLEGPSPPDSALLVLAAASLTDVLPRVAELWSRQDGTPVRFSFDATSRLAPQTVEGVPADLFFSADERWMDWVEERGGIRPETRVALLGNELVLAVPAGAGISLSNPEDLATAGVRRLALAGENVPAGRYAQAALESTGVWSSLQERVVRAGSVRGALEWLARGEVDAAVVYRTDVLEESRVIVAFSFPGESYPPVVYPAAVLSQAPMPTAAESFLAFCSSPAAAEIFRGSGFRVLPRSIGPAGQRGAGSTLSPPADATLALDPWSAVRLSLLVALAATLAGLFPAIAIGWLLARKSFPGKSLLGTVVLVPLVLPPVVTGFLMLSLLGTQTPLGAWLARAGIEVPFTLLGATLAALVVGFPLYVVSVRSAFQAVDPRYEEVAWTLGRHRWPTFLRVSLPLAFPGIAAGAVLSFARALGEFGATVVLAGNVEGSTRTIALAVYTLLESPRGRETIWLLVAASVVLSLLALLGYEVLSRRQRDRMEARHGR